MANIPVEPRKRSTGPLLIVLLVAIVAALAVWYFTRDDAAGVAATPADYTERLAVRFSREFQ